MYATAASDHRDWHALRNFGEIAAYEACPWDCGEDEAAREAAWEAQETERLKTEEPEVWAAMVAEAAAYEAKRAADEAAKEAAIAAYNAEYGDFPF